MTIEEAIKILTGYMGGKIDPESTELYHAIELAVDILESQPSLPSNLDEAAEEFTRSKYSSPCAFGGENIEEWVNRIFKTGAEWMAGQGETHEAEIIESVPYGGTKWKRCVKVWLDDQFQAKDNKLIVQIRKEQ